MMEIHIFIGVLPGLSMRIIRGGTSEYKEQFDSVCDHGAGTCKLWTDADT